MPRPERPVLSVIVPVFNEGANIDALIARITPVLDRAAPTWEVLFVDDGSADDTLSRIKTHAAEDQRLRALSFSRNFGKEIAIAAGIDHALGQGVVLIDADLQHPPEMIETFVAKWREGYDMVYGQRVDRDTDSALRRSLTRTFYDLFARFGEIALPEGAGDYRLMDRKVVEALRRLPERARFSKGLYAWVGFKSIGVPFDVAERLHGETKFSYRKLTRFAFDGLTSFSTLPLKVWTYVGMIVSLFAFLFAAMIVLETLVYGIAVPGFATLVVSVMFFSGIQLISLGVLGEYIGRIFAEVKRRPLYVVAEEIGPSEAPTLTGARDDRAHARLLP